MNVLVVGSINMDMVIKTPRLPKLGETLTGSGFDTIPGGKGANQAVALGKLSEGNSNISMVGCVGDDIYADRLIENLSQNHVNVSGVTKVATNSGVAVITVCGGDNHIILDAGANNALSVEVIQSHKDIIEWSDIVLLQLEVPMETVVYTAKLAKSLDKKVVLNPAPMTDLPDELMSNVDIFVPNEHEASIFLNREINDVEQAKSAILTILEKGIDCCIITLGKNGCVYNDNKEVYHEPVVPVKVVDTTAAGDSFIAGVITGLAMGKSMGESVKFATKVSSITVSRFGASSSLPTLQEVLEL